MAEKLCDLILGIETYLNWPQTHWSILNWVCACLCSLQSKEWHENHRDCICVNGVLQSYQNRRIMDFSLSSSLQGKTREKVTSFPVLSNYGYPLGWTGQNQKDQIWWEKLTVKQWIQIKVNILLGYIWLPNFWLCPHTTEHTEELIVIRCIWSMWEAIWDKSDLRESFGLNCLTLLNYSDKRKYHLCRHGHSTFIFELSKTSYVCMRVCTHAPVFPRAHCCSYEPKRE